LSKKEKEQPISQRIFLKRVIEIVTKQGQKEVLEQYPNSITDKDNVIVLEIKKDKQNNIIVDLRYECVVLSSDEVPKILNDSYIKHYTFAELELKDSEYHNLAIDYFYQLFELNTKETYPNIIFQVSNLHKKHIPYIRLYCGLKYYYEFLKKERPKKIGYTAITYYSNYGALYYLYGQEWIDFYEYLVKYLKIKTNKKQPPNDKICSQLIMLIEKYQYTCEDIKLGLQFFHETLGNPIPDTPSLGIVPTIMQRAKAELAEEQEREKLIQYIYQLFELDPNEKYPLIQAEVRRYHSREYGKLTYKGMLSTLDYYYNIMGNPLPQVPNVGIIPYQYNNALAFYIQRKAVKDNGDLPDKVPVVRISVSREARLKSQKLYEERYKWKPTKLISEIEVDEDETFDRL
jgi:hypothetical protein